MSVQVMLGFEDWQIHEEVMHPSDQPVSVGFKFQWESCTAAGSNDVELYLRDSFFRLLLQPLGRSESGSWAIASKWCVASGQPRGTYKEHLRDEHSKWAPPRLVSEKPGCGHSMRRRSSRI